MYQRFWHLWRELRRRRVLHAAGIYLAACWLLLQIFDVALTRIGIPQWTMAVIVWLVIIGFPVVMLVSWRFDFTLEGIKRTPPPDLPDGEDLSIRRIDYLFIILITAFLVSVSFSLASILKTDSPVIVINDAQPSSIAVLPFENISGRPEDEYLARGLAEDILHRLALISVLRVASRTASFELDVSNLDMSTIGQRLGVRSLLEGSVQRYGNRVRILTQLIDAESGYHIWSGSYNREMDDLFVIYDEISTAVVKELQLTLAPDSMVSNLPPTSDMQAYDYFLQARSILRRSTRSESAANAQKFFAKAVDRDPGFARAWAGQCQALLEWYFFQPAVKKIEMAEASCLKALELDPELMEGHVALGDLYRKTGLFEASIDEYQAALQADDGNAMAWRGLGEALAAQEINMEAESAMIRAVNLDPDDLLNFSALGGFYFALGRYSEAAEVYSQMASHPNAGASAYNGQGASYHMMGDYEKAATAYRQVISSEPTAAAYSNIGILYFYSGQFEDASIMHREAIALAPKHPVWWGNLADALLEIDGGREEAGMAYRKAADLAGELLPANPEDTELLTNLAHYHARLGDDEQATRYLARALTAAPNDVYAHYYAALVHLEAGRQQQALDEIRRSVELGYSKDLLSLDPQFAELNTNKSFIGLIEVSAQTKEQ
jgi:TolB-like protein/Flp pilus assembly protein TadD